MRSPLFLIKILNYEYWPWWLFYLPMIPYWLYQAMRAKSLAYFTAVNPSIEAGGFYGEKKTDILANIPKEYLPKTIFITKDKSIAFVQLELLDNDLALPIIAKPNIGERGTDVAKIESFEDLKIYHQNAQEDYLIQEFIDYPIELGVLYSRLPDEKIGKISSITRKEFLSITGDGRASIEELILQNPRARFQLETLRLRLGDEMQKILAKDEKHLLEPIGNHCRGTKFLNDNHLINRQLDEVFAKIIQNFEGFYYGRFDMKVSSITDLYEGKNIKIMELNGVSSDPGHIYDPSYKLYHAYRDLMWHWRRIADISIANQKLGIRPLPFKVILKIIQQHFM
jgi:hypothetical protein